tara:strand:- start:6828 stop:7550 length:723 start_codon:yes stop_codon:yes gene_type:complete
MKVWFIVCGWYYNRIEEFYAPLKELESNNEFINVFWACHREPTKYIKENFNHQFFPKIGLSDTKYQQALDVLDIGDDDIVFFMQDDLVIKDWGFVEKSIKYLNNGFKVVGNGFNYPDPFNPLKVPTDKYSHIKDYKIPEWIANKRYIDFVKKENQHLFDTQQTSYTVRLSFMCMKRGDLRNVGDFEAFFENIERPIGPPGNISQSLLGYKLTRVYGHQKFTYLGNTYQNSDYIFECARGK